MTCLAAFSEVWALQRKIKPHMFGHLSRSFEIWNCQLFPPGDFDETAHPNSSWKSLAISSQWIAVKSVGKMQNEEKRLKPLAVAEHDEKYDLWRKQCNVMVEPHLVHLGAQRQLQYIIDTEVPRSVCLFCNRLTFQFRPNQNIKHQFTDFTGHAPCCYLLRKSKVPSKKLCHLSVVPQRHELSRPLPAWWMEAKGVQGPSNMNGNRKHRV